MQRRKKAVIGGVKKAIEHFQSANLIDKSLNYRDIIHDPQALYDLIQIYRKNARLVDDVVQTKNRKPVTADDIPLVCDVTLAQIQQLLVKTCARHFLEIASREEEGVITETRTTTHFLFFKKTEQIERKVGGGFDERRVRELSRFMAFDWQLPLLPDYAELNSLHLMELDDDVLLLKSSEHIRELAKSDPAVLKKVKGLVGDDFKLIIADYPKAINGISQWTKDMYQFFRSVLGDRAFSFFSRDNAFFMACASLDKPLARIYADVLPYIATENLEEMERLNIDKADVLIGGMKYAFGDKIEEVLGQPNFSKEILRRLVESLLHMAQEKDKLVVSTQLTCKAIAPQVFEWLAKQPPLDHT